jgi:hypothetical protein
VIHVENDLLGPEDGRGWNSMFSNSWRFVVLLPFSPAEVDRMIVAGGTTDVMLAVASLRGNGGIHLVMLVQVAAVDTIAGDLSSLHYTDQKSEIVCG